MPFDQRVALAGDALQSCGIADRDDLMRVFDEPRPVKRARGQRHRSAAHAQHRGEHVLCQRKLVAADAIPDIEEAPRAPLLDRVQGVARNRLHEAFDKRLRIVMDQVFEGAPEVDFALEDLRVHHLSVAVRDFNNRGLTGLGIAAEGRYADASLIPDDRHAGHLAIGCHLLDRADASSKKVDLLHGHVRLQQHPPGANADGLEIWKQTSIIVGGQPGEELIGRVRPP